MKRFISTIFTLLLGSAIAFGQQNTLTPTYLSAAVTATDGTVRVNSNSGITAGSLTSGTVGSVLFIGGEAMTVRSINGTTLTVNRGQMSTFAQAHISGEAVWYGAPSLFYTTDPGGTCTFTQTWVTPWINVKDNRIWTCSRQTVGFWGVNGFIGGAPASVKVVSTALTGSNTAYTALLSDFIIESQFTLASADGVVTLPNPERCPGKVYFIHDQSGNAGGSYHVTLAASAINGGTTAACSGSTAYGACRVYSTGASWFTF